MMGSCVLWADNLPGLNIPAGLRPATRLTEGDQSVSDGQGC